MLVDIELTEYVLLAFLVLLGVLVRHRLQRQKPQQAPQQGTSLSKGGDAAPAVRDIEDRRDV